MWTSNSASKLVVSFLRISQFCGKTAHRSSFMAAHPWRRRSHHDQTTETRAELKQRAATIRRSAQKKWRRKKKRPVHVSSITYGGDPQVTEGNVATLEFLLFAKSDWRIITAIVLPRGSSPGGYFPYPPKGRRLGKDGCSKIFHAIF